LQYCDPAPQDSRLTEQAWKVPLTDIISHNYNLDIKNPHVGEQISHDPDELLANYRTIMAEAALIWERLKQEMVAALERKCRSGRRGKSS
jgi:type I restriction enzyme M protein